MKISIGYGGLKMKKSIRVNNIKKIYGNVYENMFFVAE